MMKSANKRPDRPEEKYDHYQNHIEAKRYHTLESTIKTQEQLTHNALHHINANAPAFILNIGCGSGLCGNVISSHGLRWIGTDNSLSMLFLAAPSPKCRGQLAASDMTQGLPMRDNIFDAAISISAVQWLCVHPHADVVATRFFKSLYRCLQPGGSLSFQAYFQDRSQPELLLQAAVAAGFLIGHYVDFPHETPAKKFYLLGNKPHHDGRVQILSARPCSVAWPSSASCVLDWHCCYQPQAGNNCSSRIRRQHCKQAIRMLRLLRRVVGGGPSLELKDGAQLLHAEVGLTCRDLLPCSGLFIVHLTVKKPETLNASEETALFLKKLAATVVRVEDNSQEQDAFCNTRESKVGGCRSWTQCVEICLQENEGSSDCQSTLGNNNKKRFFWLERVEGSQCVAILHAAKMPSLLVLCTETWWLEKGNNPFHSAILKQLTNLVLECKVSVIGVDSVIDENTNRCSCAWLVYLGPDTTGLMPEVLEYWQNVLHM